MGHILTRRGFLSGAAASGLLFAGARAGGVLALPDQPLMLEAKKGMATLLDGAENSTAIWGYGGAVPGPVIRVRKGQEVWVRLKNSLPQPTTIHWHGIRIDNTMDGVAGLTQDATPPGETFDYRFTVPDAGTFWYHPHNLSWEQVARGLYGVLVVEEHDPPDVDQDIIIVADDWRLEETGAIHQQSLGSLGDRSHAGRLGNILSINGKPTGEFPVRSGDRIRVRLVNTCNARVLELRFEDLRPQVIAIDGQPIMPRLLEDEIATLAPGQRLDLLIDMTGAPGDTHAITEVSQSRLVAARFVYGPEDAAPARTADIRLPPNKLLEPAFSAARRIDLVMTGGAMGQAERISYKGKTYGLRELVQEHGMMWAFNGNAGMPDKPLFRARRGETIAVRMVNDTRWPHAMHFHGHHFREAGNGAPWRDTILMERDENRTVYLVADNPGKWMIHCHMLEHQAGGMATWFEVKG